MSGCVYAKGGRMEIKMKNIRIYNAAKYGTDAYEAVEENIYKTYEIAPENNAFLALEAIDDEELIEKLNNMDGWHEGTGKFEDDMLIIIYKGRKYYKEISDNDKEDNDLIYVNSNDISEPELSYVTSLVFVQEPEYGENEPSDAEISQYPLEDILDEFNCFILDTYEKKNKLDPENSYIEFSSDSIDDIRKILSIVGKHVYNKEDGEFVRLVIE